METKGIPGPNPFIIDDAEVPETPVTAHQVGTTPSFMGGFPDPFFPRSAEKFLEDNQLPVDSISIPSAKSPDLFLPIPTVRYLSNHLGCTMLILLPSPPD